MLDDDLVNAWAANLGDDGLLGNNAPAMSRVTSLIDLTLKFDFWFVYRSTNLKTEHYHPVILKYT